VGKYPGFFKRFFGNTVYGETMVQCGISQPVHDLFEQLQALNHTSSLVLRLWSAPLEATRREIKESYLMFENEMLRRQGKGKPGKKRPYQFLTWTNQEVREALANTGAQMDKLTWRLQEGKLSNGTEVKRPHRKLSMFVGVLATGFQVDEFNCWITQKTCFICRGGNNTARCCRCQCGICEEHGLLLTKAGQKNGVWQGSSTACCKDLDMCELRQHQVLDWWKTQTIGR
jgi:hypothetical protein